MTTPHEAPHDWHRLFGLMMIDFFTDSPFVVEVERDLSAQQQLLDVVIVRRGPGELDRRLPDGLEDLAAHNLISFKSHREALDDWAVKELIGHYVAYRKLVSPSPSRLLPEDQFRLYAVCARFPHNLAGRVPWQARQAGVYDCQWGTDTVRVVVAGELAREDHNAPLHLFSASTELVGFGRGTYRQRYPHTSGLLRQLWEMYRGENLVMPYSWADFDRDYIKQHFPSLGPEARREVLEALLPSQRLTILQVLTPEERQAWLETLTPEERRAVLDSLPPEERRAVLDSLPPEERLAGLSVEQIRQYLEQQTADRPRRPRRPRRRG